MKFDFVIVGGGIFGLPAAIELHRRGYSTALVDSGEIPNPLAASTDISKIVRMEYGSDTFYMEMAERSIEGWEAWNDLFKTTLYHETGFFLACKKSLDDPSQKFEKASYDNLVARGYLPERLNAAEISRRFPAFNSEVYMDGFLNRRAGFADASLTISTLMKYAFELGVEVFPEQGLVSLLVDEQRATGIETSIGRIAAGQVVVCAGSGTSFIVEDLKPYMRVTGQPVFHLEASKPQLFVPEKFPVFTADISNSGYYGFPLHPSAKVVKIANHGLGQFLHPHDDERQVTDEEMARFREFLKETLPSLATDPIEYTRKCLYSDTLDGHFWIDRHPDIEGLTIGTGGSGHGLKFGPVLGEIIANAAEGNREKIPVRFRWRHLEAGTAGQEESRHSAH
jgi:glycine/D-amino acid oxidase-like deaminating enzyme